MDPHALQVLEFPQVLTILARFASSELGAAAVGAIVPTNDPAACQRLQHETTEMKAVLGGQDLPIGGLNDLTFVLSELKRQDVLLIEQIMEVTQTLRAAGRVRAYLVNAGASYPHLQALTADVGDFDELLRHIDRIFNENGGVRNSASDELKEARNEIQTVRGRLRSKLTSLMRSPSVAACLQDTGIRDHDGRPTLAIRASDSSRVRGVRRGRSDSGGTVFIEPEGVRKLGDDLEQAVNREKREVHRILRDVSQKIAMQADPLRATVVALTHIDVTYAKVRMSETFDMNPVALNSDGLLRLNDARHPLLVDLQLREGDCVVPIDVRLGDDFHTLIITGPNTGGKTVALKTIGLLSLMAMAGMHVPAAASTTIPVWRQVWADIGDEQSIEQSLSTFSSHLTQIGHIVRGADERSLVLLDELGGGTDPAEGAALARAILEHLHNQGVRTAVTTHISALKTLGYTLPGIENASIEFDAETLQPTHKVLIGTAGSSNALALARRLGLPDDLVTQAASYQGGGEAAELIHELQVARTRIHADRDAAEQQLAEALRQRERAEQELKEAEQQRQQAQVSSGQSAYRTLRQTWRHLTQLLQDEPSKRRLLEALLQAQTSIEQELDRAPAEPDPVLQVGVRVHIRSLRRAGVLQRIDRRSDKAVVQIGGAPAVTVGLADIQGL